MTTDLHLKPETKKSMESELRQGLTPIGTLLLIGLLALFIAVVLRDSSDDAVEPIGAGTRTRDRNWQAAHYYQTNDMARYGDRVWVAREANVNVLPEPSGRVGIPQGFGRHTDGGAGADEYWVTTLADSGPGSLRVAAESPYALWIRFRVSGRISLDTPLRVASNKTIDGRGVEITISNRGLVLSRVSNVIIENLRFEQGYGISTDAIGIRNESRDVWIDHCDFTAYTDGLVDITRGATDVTVSWSRFTDQNKVMLINGESADGHTVDYRPRVTIHHNLFENTYQRNPRALHGLVHAYNNYLRDWGGYGMRASENGELVSEANIFEAGSDRRALLTKPGVHDFAPGLAASIGDLVGGEALMQPRFSSRVFEPADFYPYQAEKADGVLRKRVTTYAGWMDLPYRVWAPRSGEGSPEQQP